MSKVAQLLKQKLTLLKQTKVEQFSTLFYSYGRFFKQVSLKVATVQSLVAQRRKDLTVAVVAKSEVSR